MAVYYRYRSIKDNAAAKVGEERGGRTIGEQGKTEGDACEDREKL